jgi:hypothetical protein
MISREQILQKLPPFYNRRDILVNDQDVSDIITGILTTHAQYANQYDKIAPYFIGSNNYQTGANIWHFLKNNVRYKVEPESMQMLKAPAAIVTEIINNRVNTSDCKNMSLFTGGILAAINRAGGRINWCYRFGSYKFLDKMPQHVFCVINPDTNKEIWVDAVLPTYNNKKAYYYKIDKKPKKMALISLAGTEDNFIGGKKEDRKKKRADKKENKGAKKAANKEKRKNFFKKLKDKIKKAGKFVLKYNPATAASRNAFLLLTKVNTRSLATNLKKLKDKGNNEAQTFWTKIGGNVSALNNAIESGAKKKRLGVICGPGVQFVPGESQQSTGPKRQKSNGPKPKIQRFADNPPMQNKLQRFADQQQSGARMRRLVEIKTVRRDAGGTEAALTAFVPAAVAPALQPQTSGGGGSPYSGGGGGYARDNDAPTEEKFAAEEVTDDLLDNIDEDGNTIGEAVTAGAIAAAAPIVIAIVKLLSKNKISEPGEDKNLIDDVTAAGEEAGADAAEDIEKEANGIETPTGDKIIQGTKQQPAAGAAMKLPLMPILLVGGGLLAFTLLKKK